jgi:serine/threonine protein kinase/Flp pilus assembly protein TadD
MTAAASEQSIFLHALGLSTPADQAAYLDEACRDKPGLRAELDALLAAHDRLGGGLPFTSAQEPPGAGPVGSTGAAPAGGEDAGSVIAGRYKLVEQIGEGGMGAVWMTQQTEPVKRAVAVKLIKAGMDSKQVLARFEAERQALALMDHPNIARVLDGGTAESGRPFFVMELVKGVPLTKYCDEHRLTPKQRLELFVPVCLAVQHAHQKGIIHRDIKPSNILVAQYDGRPVPKVIDFGIAKATGQQLTDRTLMTGFGAVVGTLEYMSPEQAELNQLDIDTRSDIYSLGVVLYELLTGSTPLDRKRLKQAALAEILRVIREEEPQKPSTRLSGSGDALPSISAQRQTEPAKLTRLVRGELDWLVMKALEKDRSRRYETANGFAADVQRYLADEPVQACPPSAWYRFRKFTRRNKSVLAVAALILFFIALLGGGSGWIIRDRAARQVKAANDLELALDRAELFQGQGRRAEALAALERAELLAGESFADPDQNARLAAVKEQLAADARDQAFLARFEEIRLELQSEINVQESRFTKEAAFPKIRDAFRQYGIAFLEMAPAQVAACVQGRPESVRRDLIAALDVCFWEAPQGEAQTQQWLLVTLTAADNDSWRVQARNALAVLDRKALEQMARKVGVRKQPPSFLLLVADRLPAPVRSTQLELPGLIQRPQVSKAGDTRASTSSRLELLRRIQRAYPADLWANHALASELVETGQPAEAIRYYTAALVSRPDNPGIYINRGSALLFAGEVDAAVADYRQAVALAPQYPMAHYSLSTALHTRGQLHESIAELREAIRLKNDFAQAYYALGLTFHETGRLDEAIAEYRKAIRFKKGFAYAHDNLGVALRSKGQLDEAIAEHRKAIQLEPENAKSHNNLGGALQARGQLDEAIAEYREAIRLRDDDDVCHYNLGHALHAKGRLDEAIAAYREAIRLNKDYAFAHGNLGRALKSMGRLDEAIAELCEATRLKKDNAGDHFSLGDALRLKGRLDEAIAAYREAIRHKPDYALAHYNLGYALRDKGQVDEAIAAYREAIRLKPDYAEAHCNLGQALRDLGQFADALASLRRGHELGSRNPPWPYPSAQWVRQCERLVELDGKLPGFLERKATPASAAERIELAELCILKHQNGAASRFYEEAFAEQPKLAEALNAHRYNAARAAALTGCGKGKDANKLDDMEKARLRGRALAWLGADLKAWRRLANGEPDKVGSAATVTSVLQHWLADTDFAGVRGAEALARLPEAERQPWQKLWDDVATTLAQAQAKTTSTKQPNAK